jgi:hypothetical protein
LWLNPKHNVDERTMYNVTSKTEDLELFAFSEYDEILDNALLEAGELYPIQNLVRDRKNRVTSDSNDRPTKKIKCSDLKPIVFVRFNTRMGKAKPVTLRALLDSGGSGSLVSEKYAKKLRMKKQASKTIWTTPGGTMTTSVKCQAQFTMPELFDNRVIEWDLYVAPNMGAYDMIIGQDLLTNLGIDIRFSTNTVEWDSIEIPMKESDATVKSFHVGDPDSIKEANERIQGILEAKYQAANLREICNNSMHLDVRQQEKLFSLLSKYESLFDGSLGTWNEHPQDIELKEDAKPYHAKAFPIPKIHLETLKAEVERLCKLGVLKKVNRSEWAAPTFIIPKKDGSVRFISDFRELNKRIRRKPFPIPKIQDLLLQLEGFQYATSLDLNMGYYHIVFVPRITTLMYNSTTFR